VGAKRNPQFGFAVAFGVGGTMTEVIKDVVHDASIITKEDAMEMIKRINTQKLVTGFRGKPALDVSAMAGIIVGISELMHENPHISEIDLNPIIWDGENLHVIDPRLITGEVLPEVRDEPMPDWKWTGLKKVFEPASCAIIGASMKEGSVPDTVVREMLRKLGDGNVAYLVSPKLPDGELGTNIDCGSTDFSVYEAGLKQFIVENGIKAHVVFCSSVDKVPEGVDLGIYITAAERVPGLLEEFAKKGGRSTVVLSDGFGEAGRNDLNYAIQKIAKKHMMVMIGPNCLGVVGGNANTMFIPSNRTINARMEGSAGVIVQSGGIGLEILEHLLGMVPIRSWVSCGNATCTTVTDLLRYQGANPNIKVIALYVESVPNGVEFRSVLKEVCKVKPVIVLKGGGTEEVAKATATHTGGMTTSVDIFNGVCDSAGAIRTNTVQGMANALLMLATQQRPKINNVMVVAVGGGVGINILDLTISAGNNPATLTADTINSIRMINGLERAGIANPLDIQGSTDDKRLNGALLALNAAPEIGAVVFLPYFQVPNLSDIENLAGMLGKVNHNMTKPLIVVPRGDGLGGSYYDKCREALLEQGIVTYRGDLELLDGLAIAMKIWGQYPWINFKTP
jgi:acetyltransferase